MRPFQAEQMVTREDRRPTTEFLLFLRDLVRGIPPGPYADDAAAEAAGVPIGGIYRQPAGVVAWRVT